ncbi:putative type III effector protein [Xanthomonas translucens pv. poae]|uniref:Putative type III effector protein n=3 Tax=Xanthomonas translucens group TaxID=3390202 RepID=A0A0K2ZKE8_9XANT|nr:putative type III effector protein [Xanthomonas translucens pv. poae]
MGNCYSGTSRTHSGRYAASYSPYPEYASASYPQYASPSPSTEHLPASPPLMEPAASEGLDRAPRKVSHHRLDREGECLTMVSADAYQAARRRKHTAIKDREPTVFPCILLGDADADAAQPGTIEIDNSTVVKVAGFNYLVRNDASTSHLYSTGTSKPNTPVVTADMGSCIAVACAAEKIDRDTGARLPGAKARVFHLLPFARQEMAPHEVMASLRRYVEKTQQQDLTLRVAMHGGERDNAASIATAKQVRTLFQKADIPVEFDQTCEKRTDNTPLGAVILEDHSVQFFTHIVA